MIVMDVTHQPYEIFMQNNILNPLGMTSSSYRQPPTATNEKIVATGYRADGKEIPGEIPYLPGTGCSRPVDKSC
jgi:CubicO group peptidase (beta-lactamase class C family)